MLKPGDKIIGEEIDLVFIRYGPANLEKAYVPAYHFSINLKSNNMAIGHLNLRLGTNENIRKYIGHIGFGINENYRGNKYAAKACYLIKDLIIQNKIKPVWITANPDNVASIKTLLNIGAKYIDDVAVPKGHEMYQMGELKKSRFIWEISK